jgi:hypothetical protein
MFGSLKFCWGGLGGGGRERGNRGKREGFPSWGLFNLLPSFSHTVFDVPG